MAELGQLKNLRHESNLVELKPWQSMHKSITLPMITALGEKDIPGSQLMIGFAYIDQPEDEDRHNGAYTPRPRPVDFPLRRQELCGIRCRCGILPG